MPTLLDYRRRLRSVKNTQQITRAMKFVAAAKLRRAQEGVFAARPYAREILRVLQSAMARIEEPVHPLLERRPEQHILVLVITGDKGLAGPFNTNVIRRSLEFFREHSRLPTQVIAIGKKGRDALRKRKLDIVADYMNISSGVEFRHAREISEQVIERYSAQKVDAVYAIYNEFKSVLVQRLSVEHLLPVDSQLFSRQQAERAAALPPGERLLPAERSAAGGVLLVDYIYEQPPAEIFSALMLRYVQAEIFRILLESAAAEHGARMAAMDNATNNASDLIDSLTLQMNKIRQAAITKEIIEIVSGAASASA